MNYTYTTKHRISRWVWLCLMETVANFWYSFMLMIRSSATVHISLYNSASTVALLFAAIMGALNKSSFFLLMRACSFFFVDGISPIIRKWDMLLNHRLFQNRFFWKSYSAFTPKFRFPVSCFRVFFLAFIFTATKRVAGFFFKKKKTDKTEFYRWAGIWGHRAGRGCRSLQSWHFTDSVTVLSSSKSFSYKGTWKNLKTSGRLSKVLLSEVSFRTLKT